MYKHILAATDGALLGTHAVEHAATLARAFGATMTIVTVTPHPPSFATAEVGWSVPADVFEQIRKANADKSKAILQVARALVDGVTVQTLHIEDRRPYEGILEAVEQVGADLAVMGSNSHRGVDRLILGSQVAKVLNLIKIPVLIVK
jgi:nucleotide-binding universal stress UspA family protein